MNNINEHNHKNIKIPKTPLSGEKTNRTKSESKFVL